MPRRTIVLVVEGADGRALNYLDDAIEDFVQKLGFTVVEGDTEEEEDDEPWDPRIGMYSKIDAEDDRRIGE